MLRVVEVPKSDPGSCDALLYLIPHGLFLLKFGLFVHLNLPVVQTPQFFNLVPYSLLLNGPSLTHIAHLPLMFHPLLLILL